MTEVAVAMGILGIISVIVGTVLVSTITFTRRGATEREAQQLARLTLSHVVQELREARGGLDAIALWPAAGDEPFEAIGFVSARQEVGGRPFGTDDSGLPTWRTAVYYVFDRERGELRRIAGRWDGALGLPSPDEGRVVTRRVKDMSITRERDLLKITMEVMVGRRTIRLETAILPRN